MNVLIELNKPIIILVAASAPVCQLSHSPGLSGCQPIGRIICRILSALIQMLNKPNLWKNVSREFVIYTKHPINSNLQLESFF